MRYISLFSGIEAASVAWRDLDGFEPVAFCEIDAFPSAVLAYRFPDIPNLGDITRVDWKEVIDEHGTVDLIVGGSPCQSFSIAGGRESLGGESRLMFEYIRAVDEVRPTWFLWENVPGVLSTRDNAFGQLLAEMEKLGYGMAWGTLDAQFFGVAQRRRRVFLVGCARGGGASAAVLFESESVCGNTKTSKQKREELTRATGNRSRSGSFKFHQGADAGGIGYRPEQAPTLTSDWHQPAVMYGNGNIGCECLTPWDCESKRIFHTGGTAPTLPSGSNRGMHIQPIVCVQDGQMNGTICSDEVSTTLNASHEQPIICVADDQAHSAIDVDMSGSLKVGGGRAVNSMCESYVNALCARDYKGVGNQYVAEGKLILQKISE